jgi:hypothetical protein
MFCSAEMEDDLNSELKEVEDNCACLLLRYKTGIWTEVFKKTTKIHVMMAGIPTRELQAWSRCEDCVQMYWSILNPWRILWWWKWFFVDRNRWLWSYQTGKVERKLSENLVPCNIFVTASGSTVRDSTLGTQVLGKCKRNVCKDSWKEHVLSLLLERADVVWCTVSRHLSQGPVWEHSGRRAQLTGEEMAFLLSEAWITPVRTRSVLWSTLPYTQSPALNCIANFTVHLSIRWKSLSSFTPLWLYSRKNSRRYVAGWAQSWSGRCGEEKHI